MWHSLYLSDDQRLHTASHPHNPDTGRKIYVIQGLHSDLYKYESSSLNGLPGWGVLMVVQSAVWDVNF